MKVTKTRNKLKITVLLLTMALFIASLGILSLAVSAAEEDACISTAACTGTYANGICTACGGYQPAVKNSGGAYEIGNAGQLLWFAELCNSIERTTADRTGDRGDSLITYNEYDIPYDAILTADITLNENLIVNGALTEHTEGLRNWIPIGNYTSVEESYRVDVYQGTFDGRGHTIRGLYINDSEKFRCAMFSSIGEEGVVKNVIFEDTYFASMSTCSTVVYENFGKIQGCKTYGIISVSNQAASGVCSYNYGRIEHCINYAKIFGVDDAYFFGGIVRENRGDIENCANFGALGVSQNSQIGGIAGNNFGTIKKCFSNASITSTYDWNGGIVNANQNTGVISDCYYNSTIVDFNVAHYQKGTVENTEGKAAEAFSSGEIAYLLGEGWGQTLGVNANPVFATENNRVYYGYVCNESLTDPIYTNSNAVTKERHEFELALAHDGSYTCAVCGWLDRSATMLLAYRQAADSKNTHLTVAYDVSNSSSFRRNSATISFRGGFLDNEITLGLFNGRTVNGNGENFSYGEKNTVGYVGADLSGDTLTFKYAFPPADEDHAAGDAVTVSYTIRYYGDDGVMRESSGSLDMEYVSYGITPQLTEYGATLDLNFYSTEGTVIKENVYNAGDYSVTLRDYYGAVLECPYRIEEPFDIGTSITREDTEGGIVMTIERSDANSVFVSIPEGVTAITVEGNGRPRVKVTITESVKFSYKHINSNGDEMEKFISVDIPEASEQKPIMERLGYTTVDWNDEGEYALAADGVTKYRVGSVSVYLTNCIFKSTRGMVYFTFIPGGVTTHTFSKDDILLIENGVEHALTEDVTVSVGAVLVNDHVFLDATCTVPQTCIYCSHTEGDALGHDMNAATCIEPSTCATCGHTEGDVDKNAHRADGGENCADCGERIFITINGELYRILGDITNAGIRFNHNESPAPGAWKAGDGYLVLVVKDSYYADVILYNATIDVRAIENVVAIDIIKDHLDYYVYGTNNIYGNNQKAFHNGTVGEDTITNFIIDEDAVLNIYGNSSFDHLVVTSGEMNVYGRDISGDMGIAMQMIKSLTVKEGATLTAVGGKTDLGLTVGVWVRKETVVEGVLNAFTVKPEETEATATITYIANGHVVLNCDTFNAYANYPGYEIILSVPEGASLTVPEGIKLDLDSFTGVEISGALIVEGTLICTHEGGEATCKVSAVCDVCKQSYGDIDENAHAWDEGIITKQPTCIEKGVKIYTCTHNSEHTKTEDVAIDENAHAWGEGVVTTNPTCSAVGVRTFTCTHNSEHTKTEEIPALGHAYDNACDTACNICGAERTVGGHVDADGNGQCDACTVAMSSGSESTNGGNNNAAGGAGASADEGLPAGAIIGIVTGSVAVAGIGGFSLFWFVIKKKKWSDLIGIFKK